MKSNSELRLIDTVISDYLFTSDFYEIKNWSFDLREKKVNEGYNDCFCIVFVRNGNFCFDLASKTHDTHSGHIIIEKSNYEYKLRPGTGACSIFNFTEAFYVQFLEDHELERSFFFSNPSILSILLNSSPEIDYLHHQIMKSVPVAGKLEIDGLVLGMAQLIAEKITQRSRDVDLPPSLLKNHLVTIEKAKEYMNENFTEDISLKDLASHCNVSLFHFARTFKQFTTYSPHQYLLNIRLKHAEMLLRNTRRPVTDVCFSSGFNSMEHFSTMFKQKHKLNPSRYRTK